MLSSLVLMPPCSMVRCAEGEEGEGGGETALIDQRAVPAGKNYFGRGFCIFCCRSSVLAEIDPGFNTAY